MANTRGQGTHRVVIGILLVAVGLFILLDNLQLLELGPFLSRWWPLLIILVGLWKLIIWGAQGLGSALLLMAIGILCLLATLNVTTWGDLFRLWPILLIAIGAWVLLRPTRHLSEKFRSPEGEDIDVLDAWALFGGAERQVSSSQFRGGKATTLFGGIEIDLRRAQLAEGEHALDLTALFGGIEIRVPESWDVWVTGSPIFGGIDDKRVTRTTGESTSHARLHINAFVMFAGVDIKN
jgi:predicted membrane protein